MAEYNDQFSMPVLADESFLDGGSINDKSLYAEYSRQFYQIVGGESLYHKLRYSSNELTIDDVVNFCNLSWHGSADPGKMIFQSLNEFKKFLEERGGKIEKAGGVNKFLKKNSSFFSATSSSPLLLIFKFSLTERKRFLTDLNTLEHEFPHLTAAKRAKNTATLVQYLLKIRINASQRKTDFLLGR